MTGTSFSRKESFLRSFVDLDLCFFNFSHCNRNTFLRILSHANKCAFRGIQLLGMEFWQWWVWLSVILKSVDRRVTHDTWPVIDAVEGGPHILQYWVVAPYWWLTASLDWFLGLDFIYVFCFCKVDCWSYWCTWDSLCEWVIPAPGWLPWALSNGSTTGKNNFLISSYYCSHMLCCGLKFWGLSCLVRLFFFILRRRILIFTAMDISV